MKLNVKQPDLSKALQAVSRAIPKRSTLPVLHNVLLTASNGDLKLSTTNLDWSITTRIGVQTEEHGTLTVPFRSLKDLVASLPKGEPIWLTNEEETLHLRSGQFQTSLAGITAEEFPIIPTLDEETAVPLPAKELFEAIHQVAFCAAEDEARPVLTNIVMFLEGHQMILVATDGFRLGERKVKLPTKVVAPLKLLIPAKAMKEFVKVIGKEPGGEIRLSVIPDKFISVFQSGSVELFARLDEGKYPDYEAILPKHHTTQVTVSTAEFLNACKILRKIKNNRPELVLKVTEGDLTLVANDIDKIVDARQIKLPATLWVGKPMDIAFNQTYLLEGLGAISTPEVALKLTTPNSPGVLRPVGKDDYLYLLMPMHLGK